MKPSVVCLACMRSPVSLLCLFVCLHCAWKGMYGGSVLSLVRNACLVWRQYPEERQELSPGLSFCLNPVSGPDLASHRLTWAGCTNSFPPLESAVWA